MVCSLPISSEKKLCEAEKALPSPIGTINPHFLPGQSIDRHGWYVDENVAEFIQPAAGL
ncbi:ABC transporter [Sphingopyxis macrogoltabida]|uniref:ABC transporter n=1 Tax=Sphingopyxis macrogoltabida TaxID=33050 RepID=A0AAC9AUF8_SPHMC|nr:ABC transporter [Sphingopyxis macrogoltabida]AMU88235.1 ABC transporter [Sphingopyxis macrogoltabida]